MITNVKPLSLGETAELIGKSEENKDLRGYIKKFNKLKAGEAEKLRAEIEKIDNMKIKPEHVAKISDLLPEDAEDINKIFTDVSLDEDETNKILEIVKKYR